MGEIRKQTIWGTLFIYLGALGGFVNNSVLQPNVLSTDKIGLLFILISISTIFAQFASLGINSTTTRLFIYFKNENNNHNGYLFIALSVSLIGFVFSLAGILIFRELLVDQKELLDKYFYYLIPLTFFALIFNTLDNYNKVLYNALRGIFLKEFLQKILTLITIGIYGLQLIDFNSLVIIYTISICAPAVIINILLVKDKQFSLKPQLGFIDKPMALSMISVSFFGIITSAIGIITLHIDRIMVADLMGKQGLAYTGIYGICFYFGMLIILPSRSLLKIASAYIAKAWKENDIQTLKIIYQKSCLNQFIIGIFLLIAIWINIDNIMIILGKDYEPGKYVILVIGLAYLSDMLTGTSSSIIANSKKYRVQSVFVSLMIVLIISTNLIFIPKFGIIGAAVASLISKLFVNILRFIFNWYKFKLQPYNKSFIIILIISIVSYLAGKFIPVLSNFIIDAIIRSITISLVFGSLIYISKVSDDLNERAKTYYKLFITKIYKLMSDK